MSRKFYYPVDQEGMDREIKEMKKEVEKWEGRIEVLEAVIFFGKIFFLISSLVWFYIQLHK